MTCQCQAAFVPMISGHLHTDCVVGFCPCTKLDEADRSRSRYLLSDHTAGFHSEPRPGCAGCDNAKLAAPVAAVNPHAAWCAGGQPGWACDCPVSTAQKLAAAVDWHRVFSEQGNSMAAQGELDAARRYAAEILANAPGASCDRCGSSIGPFRETAHAETICVDVQGCEGRRTPTLASVELAQGPCAAPGHLGCSPWMEFIWAVNSVAESGGAERVFGEPLTVGQQAGLGYVEEYTAARVILGAEGAATATIQAKTPEGDWAIRTAAYNLGIEIQA